MENTPFTADEQMRIGAILLGALEAARKTHELTPEQERALDEKVAFVTEASKQLGRIHWRSLFIGVLIEAVVEDALPPGFVKAVLSFTLRGLSALFGAPDFTELPRPAP